MPGAYESIATAIVGSGGTSVVTFDNIPQTYKHLQVRGSARTDGAYSIQGIGLAINNDRNVSNQYGWQRLGVINGAVASAWQTYTNPDNFYWPYVPAANTNSSLFASFIIDIHDYTNTNKKRQVRAVNGCADQTTSNWVFQILGTYIKQTTVSRLDFVFIGGSTQISQNSRFDLYGIKG
jgi:hypothetical protein